MGKKNPRNFDFSVLSDFLATPKTAIEIQKKFSIKSRMETMNLLDMATENIPIYQTDKEDGLIKYGLME